MAFLKEFKISFMGKGYNDLVGAIMCKKCNFRHNIVEVYKARYTNGLIYSLYTFKLLTILAFYQLSTFTVFLILSYFYFRPCRFRQMFEANV